mmetsp:Transcript_6713/g.16689  ORF Transcript_6713/g.16689 Transcript_6713/m.16689 type:complete len:341 (+) Transcript_6713:486-1508(+)
MMSPPGITQASCQGSATWLLQCPGPDHIHTRPSLGSRSSRPAAHLARQSRSRLRLARPRGPGQDAGLVALLGATLALKSMLTLPLLLLLHPLSALLLVLLLILALTLLTLMLLPHLVLIILVVVALVRALARVRGEPQVLCLHPPLGHAPGAVELNAQVVVAAAPARVRARHDAHEPALAPRLAPRVAHDPELHALLHAPAHHRHHVVGHRVGRVLGVHAACVLVHVVGGVDGAGDGPPRHDLCLHGGRARHLAVLLHYQAPVRVHGRAARGAGPAREALLTVVALLVGGHVHVAGVGRDTLARRVLVHALVVAAVAGAGLAAVNHVLHAERRARPRALA